MVRFGFNRIKLNRKKNLIASKISIGFYDKTNLSSVNMGIPVDLNVEANDTGRLETAPWSINHIAHGDAHHSGWCCY